MINYKNLLLLLIVVLTSSTLDAQFSSASIQEMYGLKKEGCAYQTDKMDEVATEKNDAPPVAVPPPPPPPPRMSHPKSADSESNPEQLAVLFSDFANAAKGIRKSIFVKDKKFKSGNYCYNESGLWGLKDKNDKVILKPMFDFVELDTFGGGFVGYIGSLGNYYDEVTGKPQLDKDYYQIQAVDKGVFIVQSAKGYGLVKDNETIVKPNVYRLRCQRFYKGNAPEYYFVLQNKARKEQILLNDFTTYLPFGDKPIFIDDTYVMNKKNVYNLQEKRKMVCDDKFFFTLISAEKKLLSVVRAREKSLFLIDVKGNFVANQLFKTIGKMNDEGFAAASIEKPLPNIKRPIKHYGLIDEKGNWVVKPIYQSLYYRDGFWMVKDFDAKLGVIDNAGKIIIPIENNFIEVVNDKELLCGTREGTVINSKIIDKKTGKIVKDGLDYQRKFLWKDAPCDGEIYKITGANGSYLMNEKEERITDFHSYFKVKTSYFAATGDNNYKFYDCEGNVIKFNINGTERSDFVEYQEITDDLTYVYLSDKTGYLLPKSGAPKPFDYPKMEFFVAADESIIIPYSYYTNIAGILDENGAALLPMAFQKIGSTYADKGILSFTTQDGKSGFFDLKGNLLTEELYDEIKYMKFGMRKVRKGTEKEGKYGVYDVNGKLVFPVEYERIYLMGGVIHAVKMGTVEEILFDRTGKRISE